MSAERIEQDVRTALEVLAPRAAIRALRVDDGGHVAFILDPGAAPLPDDAVNRARALVLAVPGVTAADVRMAQPVPDLGQRQAPQGPAPVQGVGAVIAIGSGKGGVGKSTVAANLALALADLGLQVGLLDADIYGPSQTVMLGATGRPVGRENRIIPLAAHGIRCISVGMLMEPGRALVWRGPMLVTAIRQLLHDVIWDGIDVLVVDLPPGTGDVQITLAQTVPIDGAVIVTTPQDVALIDARLSLIHI